LIFAYQLGRKRNQSTKINVLVCNSNGRTRETRIKSTDNKESKNTSNFLYIHYRVKIRGRGRLKI